MASASSSSYIYPVPYSIAEESDGGDDPTRKPNGNGNNNNGHARDAAENLFKLCDRCLHVLHVGNCRCLQCDSFGHVNHPCPMRFLRYLHERVAYMRNLLPSRDNLPDELNAWYGGITNFNTRLCRLSMTLSNRSDDLMHEVDRLSAGFSQILRDCPRAALGRERSLRRSGQGQVQQPPTPTGPVNGFNPQPTPSSSRHGPPPPSGMDDISPEQHGRQHALGKRKAEDEDDGHNGAKRRRTS